ncbi:MAG: TM1266 family iron-only hydrogenase system putative regulator [Bacteroidota bacterium]
MNIEKRLGVIAIIMEQPQEVQERVNSLISEFNRIVVGRMGIPHRERRIGVISLIVDGAEDEINTLTGRLGNIVGVSARATMAKKG